MNPTVQPLVIMGYVIVNIVLVMTVVETRGDLLVRWYTQNKIANDLPTWKYHIQRKHWVKKRDSKIDNENWKIRKWIIFL